jgi:hypothetical protein
MRYLAFALVFSLVAGNAFAGPFGLFRKSGGQTRGPVVTVVLDTAQNAANYMASIGRMGHFGNPAGGYEGVGAGSTPEEAEMNCCFRHKWTPRDVGIAQGTNGVWYACCRY